ncbi:MAG: hypothetical protein HZB16_03390 [Armatimonadetes bacterium]|nr:hypothetical protein [Armatimonadota bacterium]
MRETLEAAERMKAVSALVIGVEGGLIDGLRSLGGDCGGLYSRVDLLGMELALTAGWRVALVSDQSAEALAPITSRVEGVEVLASRGQAVMDWVDLGQVAYLGSDLADLPAMLTCRLSVTPRDGVLLVRKRADLILETPGGRGAVRELVERLLTVQGRFCDVLKAWYTAQGMSTEGGWLNELEAEAGGSLSKIGFRR